MDHAWQKIDNRIAWNQNEISLVGQKRACSERIVQWLSSDEYEHNPVGIVSQPNKLILC
jgi:hypothetical protein